jgi:bifunctional non-homologous end joining protein LigD
MPLMLCTLVAEPFDDPKWSFEPKFDGQRILGRFDGQHVELISRNGHNDALWFPEIVSALQASLTRPALVDGEIVSLAPHGQSSFRRLQQRFHLNNPRDVARRAEQFPACLYLFDLLYSDRYDLTALPLRERKDLLRDAIQWSDQIRWTQSTPREGLRLYEEACHHGQEGIIGKRLDSRYVPGRSRDWVKIKCINRQEFVIGGFTDPAGARVGLGALLVGYYQPNGKTFAYAGKVGTGFDTETLLDLRHRLGRLEQTRSPFTEGDPPRGSQVHWVKPQLVAEIGFAEWTQNRLLRQPHFEGLRIDKKARQVHRELPKDVPAT